MATTFKLYKDSGLTQVFTPGVDFIGPVTNPPEDFVLYLGSTDAANKVEAASNPGVDQIVVFITDTDPGNKLETTDVKLATSAGGLPGATGGASLNLGTSIVGGVGNAQPIHIRVSYSGGLTSDQTVGIALNTLVESVI